VSKLVAMLFAAGMCGSTLAIAGARADIAFGPCGEGNEYACGHLTVPLDPSGRTPGTVTLAIRRHRAPLGSGRVAVVALAGGPGQAAIPFTEQFLSVLGPILQTRDEIVFDQRGTGLSSRLRCRAVEHPGRGESLSHAVAVCAQEIGTQRAFYTTADTVADIEAIRVAGGYEKLVLYGTSYGTKVAEEYAQAYPGQVEALVLDSVVPPNGPDPLNRATFAAVPRILHQLCAARACVHITSHPTADVRRLVRRLDRHALKAHWIDGFGRSHRLTISSEDVLETLIAGDLEPTLRSEFPAAVRAALDGDGAALARLIVRAGEGEEAEGEGEVESFDTPLYYATTCEEADFPWSRAATPPERLALARAQIRALGPGAVAPFSAGDALDLSDLPACAGWPFSTPAPPVNAARLPAVPTLILSGADDLRTPTANAREVAAEVPGAHLLVVPDVGHSVLGDDLSGCSTAALQALFAGATIRPCGPAHPEALDLPTPLPPANLGDVKPASGNSGRPGRTLEAVALTLRDLARQVSYLTLARLGSGSLTALGSVNVGGLHAGWAELTGGKLRLHGYVYVPGVRISGTVASERISLTVEGTSAARGTITLGAANKLAGVLEGMRLHPIAAGSLSREVRSLR
jgi:pimeloyl-ACP methyl ester carboxylesterase